MNVTRENLTDVMEFDHVIYSHGDGTVSEPGGMWAPEVYYDDETDIDIMGDGWTALTGWTGQYGYNGAVMHQSEFIGGALADHIIQTRGYYVAVVVEDVDDPDALVGWAVLYREEP